MKSLKIIGGMLAIQVASITAQNNNLKPNIILILADDLGYADLSIHGSNQIHTPHIDALAETGVYFTNGYVSAPVSSPSRAGLLTGKNQVRFGYDNNLIESCPYGIDPECNGLPLSQKTIAERLKELGYVTGLIGKWHLGYKPHFHPLNRGFDEFWGYQGGGHDYFEADSLKKGYKGVIECNYKEVQPITYLTDDKGDECVDFIKRHQADPFFLFASFNAPHAPMQATEADLKLFEHIADEKRRTYCAMVHRLDINIGKISQTLKEQGLAGKTLVVFLSDNGGPCDANASLNAPLNGQKGILLEGGVRVPFILSWPGRIPEGILYEHPIISLDLFPTFVELAGGKVTEDDDLDGVNLMPFITHKNTAGPHETLCWRFTVSAAIRDGNWKLIRLPDRLPALYDLSVDASERNDVSLKYIDQTKLMLKKLGQWDIQLPHPVIWEEAMYKPIQLNLYDAPYILSQPLK